MDFLNQTESTPVSPESLLIALGIGAILGLILRAHFVKFGQSLSNRAQFGNIFLFVILTTALIIALIKTSLALSLGLIGALSIVRFRTPIKEPEELGYLFLAIGIGLGLGADQIVITVAASLAILAFIAIIRHIQGNRTESGYYLSILTPGKISFDQVKNELTDYSYSLKRFDVSSSGTNTVLLINDSNPESAQKLAEQLADQLSNSEISLIDRHQFPSH